VAAAETIDLASQGGAPVTGYAERYALALLSLADDARAQDPAAIDRISGDVDTVMDLWRADASFRAFVADPRLDTTAQRNGAFAILERAGTGTEIHNLVGVMIANRRLSALPLVAQAFGAALAARRGQQVAEVASAHPLSDTQRAQLTARLTEAGYSGVKLRESVDPALLGGLVVRIGSRLYDNSIRSKLQRLQYAMKGTA